MFDSHPELLHFAVKSLTHGFPLLGAVWAGHAMSERKLAVERRLAELRDRQSVERDRALGNALTEIRGMLKKPDPVTTFGPRIVPPANADEELVEEAEHKRAEEHLVTLRRTIRSLRDLLDTASAEVDAAEARFRATALEGVDTSLLGPPSV